MAINNRLYFPHDYHARHDPKLTKIIFSEGCELIGIYWCIIEILYEEGGFISLSDIDTYAKSLNTTSEKVEKVLKEYDLFTQKGDKFFSEEQRKRLKHINEKRCNASTSAKQRWNTNAMQTHSERNARKEKKRKEYNIGRFTPPTLQDIKNYSKERNSHVNTDKFFNFYEAKGWFVGKNKMKDWKAAFRNWEHSTDKPNPKTTDLDYERTQKYLKSLAK